MLWIVLAAAAVVFFLVAQFIYLATVLTWEDQNTVGLTYYGKPPAERAAFKATLAKHARRLRPVLRLLGRFSKFTYPKATFQHRGIAGPRGTCKPESFAKADTYDAAPEDVFIVTQMKCGTTWMQQVIYETLLGGQGDLVERGATMYAHSPWLEARKSVSIEEAPLISEARPSRIIKTHLPVTHCPWNPNAKYVYVARHPVSCFASCADFVALNAGVMAPPLSLTEEWFMSEDWMWWGTWPNHVEGWWKQSQEHGNVLFLHFEDMKADLAGIVDQVASFLGVPALDANQRADVVRKSGFAYMQEHKNAFEMHPPHILATDAQLFVRGTADRHKDVPADTKARISAWCAAQMEMGDYPLSERYPDVTSPPQD